MVAEPARVREVRHAERIREQLRRAGADALWVHPSVGFTYLTGLAPIALERPAALVILAGGGLRGVTPAMLAPDFAEIAGAELVAWDDGEGPADAIGRVLAGVGRLLIDPWLPAGVAFALRGARPGLDVELDPGILAALRRAKQPDELERLRAAGREADAAVSWIAGRQPAGLTEQGLALELQARFLGRGVRPYDGYVIATGANAALPHHETGATPLDPGAPLLVDLGCIVEGYYSDTTRVLAPPGADPAVDEAYAIVAAAHDAVIAGLEPGLPCGEADRLARAVITAAGHGEHFVHRTGHGVGLEIHEEPYLLPGGSDPLAVGDVFSVEPGIYVPGRLGVRFENLVHLGPDGPELLNASPRAPVLAAAAG
jgi:Xaa-Pro aminopeptidase